MVNTRRSKISRKTQNQNTPKTCLSVVEDSDQKPTESGALIGSNDDLLTEILIRLPVTSILGFKSVSKHWRLLLSQKHFTQRYDKLSKSPGFFASNKYVPFDVENPNTPPFRSLDPYFDRSGFDILQSCNGLLLCSPDLGPKGHIAAPKYYVFNPTTKQLATIPPLLGGLKVHKTIRFMGLAYHQTDCPHYKLVCIRFLECFGEFLELFQLQTYSSDTGKWKISVESFHAIKPAFFYQGVYWNGAVFWGPYYQNYLYFKLDVEQLQTLPLPVGLPSSQIIAMYFGESRGHLHLIVRNKYQDYSLHWNVYEMLSDHSGWFVKYQLQLDELPGAFPEVVSGYGYCDLHVIDVVRGEEEENTFLVLRTPEKFITYNVHDKSYKQIFSFSTYSYMDPSIFHRYTETLSSF
ncbi:F-box protein At5g07610 [Helianthus annuus]|nr:F-box protein At5g07610 [Helianthus annuus]